MLLIMNIKKGRGQRSTETGDGAIEMRYLEEMALSRGLNDTT